MPRPAHHGNPLEALALRVTDPTPHVRFAALFALELSGMAVIVVVVALQALAELFVGRNYGLALIAVTPLALLMVHLAAPVPAGTLIVDRGLETVIGVAVGLLVGWLTRSRSVTGTDAGTVLG